MSTKIERKSTVCDVVHNAKKLGIQLTPEIWKTFKLFIETGMKQESDIDMPDLGRKLVIRLYPNKESYVCLRKK